MLASYPVTAIFFFASHVYGQTTNVQCNPGSNWTFNSLGQSSCLMAAYMMGACQPDGNWDVQALPDVSFRYEGPTADEANVCTCSSVSYALSSACGFCQGGGWPEWSVGWSKNCPAQDINNGSFPHPIPSGTRIPEWAFVPIAGFYDEFDAVQAMDIGDKLESTGTAIPTGTATGSTQTTPENGITHIGSTSSQLGSVNNAGSTAGVSPQTSSGSTSTTGASAGNTHGKDLGAIVGGVVSGLIGLAVIAGSVIYLSVLQKRRSGLDTETETRARFDNVPVVDPIAPSTHNPDASQSSATKPPSPSQWASTTALITIPSSPVPPSPAVADSTPVRLYDPSDPSTFPPTPTPVSFVDMAQVTYPNATSQVYHPIPEL